MIGVEVVDGDGGGGGGGDKDNPLKQSLFNKFLAFRHNHPVSALECRYPLPKSPR